eukprot:jgi/Bigna1/145252/aug1.96_g19960
MASFNSIALTTTEAKEVIRSERAKRRIQRLKQVRSQERLIARSIRERFKAKQERLRTSATAKVKREWEESQEEFVESGHQQLRKCMETIGLAHKNAVASTIALEKQAQDDMNTLETWKSLVQKRGKYAMSLIQEKKRLDENSIKLRNMWRERARKRALIVMKQHRKQQMQRNSTLPISLIAGSLNRESNSRCRKSGSKAVASQDWNTTRHHSFLPYSAHHAAEVHTSLRNQNQAEIQRLRKKKRRDAQKRGQKAMAKQLIVKQDAFNKAMETLRKIDREKKLQKVLQDQEKARRDPSWFSSKLYEAATAIADDCEPAVTWMKDQKSLNNAFERQFPLTNLQILDSRMKISEMDVYDRKCQLNKENLGVNSKPQHYTFEKHKENNDGDIEKLSIAENSSTKNLPHQNKSAIHGNSNREHIDDDGDDKKHDDNDLNVQDPDTELQFENPNGYKKEASIINEGSTAAGTGPSRTSDKFNEENHHNVLRPGEDVEVDEKVQNKGATMEQGGDDEDNKQHNLEKEGSYSTLGLQVTDLVTDNVISDTNNAAAFTSSSKDEAAAAEGERRDHSHRSQHLPAQESENVASLTEYEEFGNAINEALSNLEIIVDGTKKTNMINEQREEKEIDAVRKEGREEKLKRAADSTRTPPPTLLSPQQAATMTTTANITSTAASEEAAALGAIVTAALGPPPLSPPNPTPWSSDDDIGYEAFSIEGEIVGDISISSGVTDDLELVLTKAQLQLDEEEKINWAAADDISSSRISHDNYDDDDDDDNGIHHGRSSSRSISRSYEKKNKHEPLPGISSISATENDAVQLLPDPTFKEVEEALQLLNLDNNIGNSQEQQQEEEEEDAFT